jgi:hypothetical protein
MTVDDDDVKRLGGAFGQNRQDPFDRPANDVYWHMPQLDTGR